MPVTPHDSNNERPLVSVIIPAWNAGETLALCLNALFASTLKSFEVIVVNDGSTDGTAACAQSYACDLILLEANAGPAAARNEGARRARAPLLFFLDADVLVQADALERAVEAFQADPGLDAVFGSYTEQTIPEDFFSRYKNLVHHHTHQTSSENAVTFCAGFGAIRSDVFRRLGGFDPRLRFLEDIELGHRLYLSGRRVRLIKSLQFTHCKRYTLASLVRSDFWGRAVPWSRMILETRVVKCDMNMQLHNIASTPLAYLILAGLFSFLPVSALLPMIAAFVLLNFRFLLFAGRAHGLMFATGSVVFCWFSYLYSGLGALVGAAQYAASFFASQAPVGDDSEA